MSKDEASAALHALALTLTGNDSDAATKLVELWMVMGRSHNAEVQKLLDVIRGGE